MTQFDPNMVAQMLMQPVGRESLSRSISDENYFEPIEIPSPDRVAPLDMQGGFFIDPETAGKVAYGGAVTGASFLPGAGVVDAAGGAVDVFGQPLPSFGENIRQGDYFDAALQGLGVAGDVATVAAPLTLGASAVLGAMLKAPGAARKIGKATDVASDIGSIAKVEPPTETKPGIIAFHGSGADFDEFRLEKIGTGEGAQAFGYGLYFTDSEDIAKFYETSVGKKRSGLTYEGEVIPSRYDLESGSSQKDQIISSIADEMQNYDQPASRLINDRIKRNEIELAKLKSREADELTNDIITSYEWELEILKGLDANKFKRGKTYKVGIEAKPEELLDYDLSFKEQPEKFKKILKPLYEKYSVSEAADFGTLLASAYRNVPQDTFMEELLEKGIKGIKYFDANSRKSPFEIFLSVKGKPYDTEPIKALDSRQAKLIADDYKEKGFEVEIKETGSRNYVIFDDKLINILEKYGIVGPVAVSATAAALKDDDRSL